MPGKKGMRGRPRQRTEDLADQRPDRTADVEKPLAAPAPEIPPSDPEWHPRAAEWYESLKLSVQAQYLEPSDWAFARYLGDLMTTTLGTPRVNAQLVTAITRGMDQLLTTEGARRAARLELQRPKGGDEADEGGGEVALLDDYRYLYG